MLGPPIRYSFFSTVVWLFCPRVWPIPTHIYNPVCPRITFAAPSILGFGEGPIWGVLMGMKMACVYAFLFSSKQANSILD